MGRVRQQPVDPGEPGHYYFEVPTVVNVAGKAKPFPETRSITTESALAWVGRVRLRSSHVMHNYLPPDDVVYELTEYPKQIDLNEYIRRMEVGGFGEGAVVTRRYQPKGRWRFQHQWGVIVITHTVVPSSAAPFKPYSVKWFNDMSIEPAWAEDLIVIHSYLDEHLLKDIVESQGIDIEEK